MKISIKKSIKLLGVLLVSSVFIAVLILEATYFSTLKGVKKHLTISSSKNFPENVKEIIWILAGGEEGKVKISSISPEEFILSLFFEKIIALQE